MTVTLNNITGSDTFDTWRERTNDLMTVADKSVTMSGDANVGDILLTGNLTFQNALNKITVTKIEKTSLGTYLSLESDTKVTGSLTIDPGTSAANLIIGRDGTEKFKIFTDISHNWLRIQQTSTGNYIQIQDDLITTSGLRLAEDALPTVLTRRISHTGTGGDRSSFSEVDISDGVISASTFSADTATLTSVDINGGAIDSTTIGANTPSSGSFTSVSTTGDGDFTAGGTGGFKGDLKTQAGATVIDVDALAAPYFYGTAASLSDGGVTAVLEKIYPVGSLYLTTQANVTPFEIFGVGSSADSWIPYCEGASPIGYQHWNNITNSRDYGDYYTEVYVGGSDGEGVKDSSKIAQHDIVVVTGFSMGNGTYTVLSKSGDWIRINRNQSLGHAGGSNRKIKNEYARTLGEYQGQQGITLSTGQMPKHRHQLGIPRDVHGYGDAAALVFSKNYDETVKFEHYSDYQGDNERINIVGKVQTIYIWKRIS